MTKFGKAVKLNVDDMPENQKKSSSIPFGVVCWWQWNMTCKSLICGCHQLLGPQVSEMQYEYISMHTFWKETSHHLLPYTQTAGNNFFHILKFSPLTPCFISFAWQTADSLMLSNSGNTGNFNFSICYGNAYIKLSCAEDQQRVW